MNNIVHPFVYVNDSDVESFKAKYINKTTETDSPDKYNEKLVFLGSTGMFAAQGNLYGNSSSSDCYTKEEIDNKGFIGTDEIDTFLVEHIKQDLTNEKHIIIDRPSQIVKVNLIMEEYPDLKEDAFTGELEFLDTTGHYFKKPISNVGCQGSMSYVRHFPKQSIKLDFTDCDIKFGNWPTQDSFHIKAWFIDGLRGKGIVVYRAMTEINNSMGYHLARPWRRLYSDTLFTGSGDAYNDYDTEATGVPDGFPIALYFNGEFYGIFTWTLKKDRANYHQKKDNPLHIHIDSTDTNWETFMFNSSKTARGNIVWDKTCIRNPNNLITTETAEMYVDVTSSLNTTDPEAADYIDPETMFKIASADAGGFNPSEWTDEHIANVITPQGFNNDPYVWYITSKGKTKYFHKESTYKPYDKDNPSEIISDESIDEYTARVRASIQRLSDFYYEYSQVTLVTGVTEAQKKAKFEEYFDPDWMIDYLLTVNFIYLSDCIHRNTQWCTWDGIKWYPLMYDTDTAFGCHWLAPKVYDEYNHTIDTYVKGITVTNNSPWRELWSLYKNEIYARYNELVDLGFFTVEYWNNKLDEWVKSIGYDYYKKEFEKWPQTPGYRDPLTNSEYWKWRGSNNRAKDADGNYINSKATYALYSSTKTYVPGDVVYMGDVGATEDLCTFFECIKKCTGESPVTCSYDDTVNPLPRYMGRPDNTTPWNAHIQNSGMKYGGFYESIQRVTNLLTERKKFMDEYFHYESIEDMILNSTNNLKGE